MTDEKEVTAERDALRLADALERAVRQTDADDDVIDVARWFVEDAAAELRRQHAEIEEWKAKAANWMASPEAAQRLEGYRELGQRAERAEAQRDALRAELREATEAVNDPAVNNLRTLPEAIRMLRADAERYRYVVSHARRLDILGWSLCQASMFQLSSRIDAARETT